MENVKWYLYILYSVSADKYYTGITQDLEDRLSRHNQGRNTSTKNGAPWILKYLETYSSRGEAQQREYQIKGRKSRKYIEDLISAGQSVPLRKPS
jgi:putative endonuclease